MASPISETWVYATMLIRNEWNEMGTGFLVFRPTNEKEGRVFLITNKHVLNKKKELRENAREIEVFLNIKNPDGSISGESAMIPLILPDGQKSWKEHPDGDVDVLAIDITGLIISSPQIEKKWASYADIADENKRKELDITIGDEIMSIGYPLGLKHRKTNFPLVRAGIIATKIGESLEDEIEESGVIRKRILRGFLIDGATIPGSSGSPVVLKPLVGRIRRGGISLKSAPQVLLGIIAETKIAPIQASQGIIPSFAGLGLAFDAETIKETIELFF